MQQATQLNEQAKSGSSERSVRRSAPETAFVINLCSSTSPVALSPPDHAGLKRFAFFVSRRREEGRERFRLHMGYFDTQEEAEKLLDIVREIYPGAWAGLAPGQRLRAAAATAAAAQLPAAAIEREVAPSAPPLTPVATAAVLESAPVAQQPAVTLALEMEAPHVAAQTLVAPPPAQAPAAPAEIVSFDLMPDHRGRQVPAAMPEAQSAPAAASVNEHEAATRSLNDVRAAIASLEDTSAKAPVLRPIPELKPALNIPVAKPPVPIASKPIELVEELNDEAAMQVLEAGAKDSAKVAPAATGAKPQAEAPPSTEKAVYAVQLMWSVQPIDVAQVPQLAIFSAYTLYGAEGNRDGRRWYGLRLGFFTDAVSAKQVAHYVRSEFSTVSVVPVTLREKERAKVASGRPADPAAVAAPTVAAKPTAAIKAAMPVKPGQPATPVSTTKFDFIEDKPIAAVAKAATARPPLGPRTGRGAPGKRAKLRTPAQAAARDKSKKLTLEETLEILGAGDLKMDDGRKALLNSETAANAAAPRGSAPQGAKSKPSRLGKLFERLSERIGN